MVDGATLERLCGGNSTGGSNPPLSATFFSIVLFHSHALTNFLPSCEAQERVERCGRVWRATGDVEHRFGGKIPVSVESA